MAGRDSPTRRHTRPPSPAYLVAEGGDNQAQVGEAAVDGLGLLEAVACGEGLVQPLAASQVHQAQHGCRGDKGGVRVEGDGWVPLSPPEGCWGPGTKCLA